MGELKKKGRKKIYILDDKEKKLADELFKNRAEISYIVQEMFKDASLDGRSAQGKAITEYLALRGKTPKTTKYEARNDALTEQQIELLKNEVFAPGSTALEVAQYVFDNPDIKPLTTEHRLVLAWLRENRRDIIEGSGEVVGKWKAPESIPKIVSLVNEYVGTNFKRDELSEKIRRQMTALKNTLGSKRFIIMINRLNQKEERDLVESSLIKHIWDKAADLTIDEENMYIGVCMAYVDQVHARERRDKLHAEVMNCTDREYSIKLNENLKTASQEVDRIAASISKDLNTVTKMRNERIESGGGNSSTMLGLVEAWQESEERKKRLLEAKMRAKVVSQVADNIESVSDFKARILGISKDEIV